MPGLSTPLTYWAVLPPMVMAGFAVIAETGSEGTSTSAGGAGSTGPKPVPQSVIVSPGLAGADVCSEPKNPAGATLVSPFMAAAYFPQAKNAGENFCIVTWNGVEVPLPLLTMTSTVPVFAPAGASTFSCVGLM